MVPGYHGTHTPRVHHRHCTTSPHGYMPASVPGRLLARLRGKFGNRVSSGSVTYRHSAVNVTARNVDNVVVFPKEHNDTPALDGKGVLPMSKHNALHCPWSAPSLPRYPTRQCMSADVLPRCCPEANNLWAL